MRRCRCSVIRAPFSSRQTTRKSQIPRTHPAQCSASTQPIRQAIGPCADRTRSKADDHIAGIGLLAHQTLQIVLILNGPRMTVTRADQPRDQIITRRPFYRVFAGGIYLGDGDDIGLVEAGTKLVEVMMKARVPVWLMHCNHAALASLPRGP